MRGKGFRAFPSTSVSRITPAYAGKSYGGNYGMWQNRDHPRLCGEKLITTLHMKTGLGSPPPMRGKGYSCRAADPVFGITPAYAGKSI